jgi:CheY-like chemotaxis protein
MPLSQIGPFPLIPPDRVGYSPKYRLNESPFVTKYMVKYISITVTNFAVRPATFCPGRGTGPLPPVVVEFGSDSRREIFVDSERRRHRRNHWPAEKSAEGKDLVEDMKKRTGTILVAEDEPAMRELIGDILESGGFSVIAVEDGVAALSVYAEKRDQIDLVILDMNMPGMNGREVLRSLKGIDNNVLVLLSTGYGWNGQAPEISGEGAAGFLAKPYQVGELLGKVEETLRKSRKR